MWKMPTMGAIFLLKMQFPKSATYGHISIDIAKASEGINRNASCRVVLGKGVARKLAQENSPPKRWEYLTMETWRGIARGCR